MSDNRRILVVDDNRMIHEDFRKILAPQQNTELEDEFEAKLLGKERRHSPLPSFELMFAAKGQDGAMITKHAREIGAPIALAFIDIRMPPGWDGIETIEHIWAHDPQVQIAICTAYSDYTCDKIIEKFGHTDQLLFIKKPFDNVEIYQIACAMVNKWNLMQQVKEQVSTLGEVVKERTQQLELANEKQKVIEKQFYHAQKMEAISRLTGGVAHDFNNLLTVIMGYVELLISKKPALDQDVIEKLKTVQQASKRTMQLTQQLLAFSRQQVSDGEIVNLNEIIKNIRQMLERVIGEDISMTVNLLPGLQNIRADSGQIEQVVMNLVVNARDAMTGRVKNLLIKTGVSQNANKEQLVTLTISDNGKGMTKEVKERLFEPFFTTKDVGEGTGLGLSTAYGIITRYKGQITVESEPEKGTTFVITFPPEQGSVNCVAAPPSADSTHTGSETIMLVEDEDAVRSLTKHVLCGAGYTVIEAKNGLEALQVCKGEKPQLGLLLTDVIMPEMGGKDLAEHFSALMPQTPVLFMSGYLGEGTLLHGPERVAANFLQKPFLPAELLQKVHTMLPGKVPICND